MILFGIDRSVRFLSYVTQRRTVKKVEKRSTRPWKEFRKRNG